MDFAQRYNAVLLIVLLAVLSAIALINWLNRRHGGFMKGWAGAVFIAVCWTAAIAYIVLQVRR